jgi:hypothetical protein
MARFVCHPRGGVEDEGMIQIRKLVVGWGLQQGKRLRSLPNNDCLGHLKRQPCMWATKREAKDMAFKGEVPVRLAAWYEVRP